MVDDGRSGFDPAAKKIIRQLELENQLLAERAEEIFLLGRIAAEVTEARSVRGVLMRGLERIAILKDTEFAAYGRWEAGGLDLAYGYFLHGDNLEAGKITLGGDLRERVGRGPVLLHGAETSLVGLPPPVRLDGSQASLTLIPALAAQDSPGCFVFAGRCSEHDQQERSLLVTRAVEIMSLRLENLRALNELSELNRRLDAKVAERTGQLEAANTELQLKIEQLEQAQKMEVLGRLAGGIAHDFNNILTAVTGHVELAALAVPEDDPLQKDLQAIREAGERGARLSRQLLSFSRRQVFKKEPLDVNASVRDLAKVIDRLIGEDIELELDLAPDTGSVLADRGRIDQVLMNLVLNARDAMSGGGRIRLSTRSVSVEPPTAADGERPIGGTGRHVELAVADDGAGIPAELRARIFEPFFTTKEAGKGTGLGLAMVYNICRRHDGWVQVDSEVGQGTVFRVYFPELAAEAVSPPSAVVKEPARGDEAILLVEDDRTIREVLVKLLDRLGYRATSCAHGQEALELLEDPDQDFDLMITDVVMPVMGGGELAARARTLHPRLPILFLSGYTDDQLGPGDPLANADGFIQKPVTMAELAAAVRRILG